MGAFHLSKAVVYKYKCIDKDIPIAPPLLRPISKSPFNQQREEQKQGQEEEEENDWNLREKLLYLESIGVDSYRAVEKNSQISTTGLQSIESVVKLLQSMGIDKNDIGRMAGMCPEVLTLSTRQLRGVFTFLLREAKVPLRNIKRAIFRRPRLLGCSVKEQLRPTLYFLQRLGITQVDKYSFLLSCSVEDKFIPRLDFIQSLGLSYDDAASMFVRFPVIFNYSIDGNLKPKFNYLMEDMGRNVDDLRKFPQYFAYSLEKRIKPRHRFLLENDVQLPLSVMLRASDALFYRRVKDLQDGSLHSDNCNELDSLYLYKQKAAV
ncbi:hypothetical protein KI387_021893 [Taxus chinensis]|uniref:Uncharacterized protein n=1 Tax=Taxus chinensis TaxID=29808 RepID=A0AA38GB47_TAXCH|nr:hypothetical protein KI387_021893 [Taxus chinensis]